MMYKKVSIEEELPPINKFVTCFYDSGETMVYKRFETGMTTLVDSDVIDTSIGSAVQKDWAWIMRDGIADRTPKEEKITHWLKDVKDITGIPKPIETIYLNVGNPDINIRTNSLLITIAKSSLQSLLINALNDNRIPLNL